MDILSEMEEIDRSLVVIFDIEGFSKENPIEQANLVNMFIDYLIKKLYDIRDIKPDVFSTGDGAIVSVGRNINLGRSETKLFMDFVLDFTLNMLKQELSIRTAVNYSDKDNVILIDDSEVIDGKYIQIGDTINNAARVITFCEPREIMIHESVYLHLRNFALENMHPFFENDPIITKHNLTLKTYTYDPPEGERDFIYSPHSPSHRYKKYNYFPSVKGETLKYFMDQGLEFELRNVIEKAFSSMRDLNDSMKFVSWNNVLEVLMQLKYDETDTVYVLSRNDRESGFWTQTQRSKYINYLNKNANNFGYINQTRVMVYNDDLDQNYLPMPFDDISHDLKKLHNTNTYFSIPSSGLMKYEKLKELIFGFTLSKKHKFAIIPIPAPEALGINTPELDNIGVTLKFYQNYTVTDGPLRAIITSDKKYVAELIEEMETLLKDNVLFLMK